MPAKSPKIDRRSLQDLVDLTKDLMVHYCPEWADKTAIKPGQSEDTLIQIFARMMDIVIQRLNRVPDKNFLAFLELMGIRLSPPRVAEAPLSFTMAKGTSQYGFVPAGTQVAGETKDKEVVVFETEQDLTVILPKLVKAVSIDPQNDRYRDHSQAVFTTAQDTTETLFTGVDLIPHRLYLGHDTLFSFKEESAITLEIGLKKELSGIKNWEVNWYCHTDDLSKPKLLTLGEDNDLNVVNLLQSGSICLTNVSEIPEQTLTGFDKVSGLQKSWKSRWIFAELKTPIPKGSLPELVTISASISVSSADSITPDLAFLNNLPIDLTKDFSPFGEKPRFNDTFYLASQEVFAKKDATITIHITLSDTTAVPAPNTSNITLIWEFCDGKTWQKIGETTQDPFSFVDTTNAFTKDGEIKFTCPAVGPYILNGEENYWVRVRIIGGNYGNEATYQEQTVEGKYRVILLNGVKMKIVEVEGVPTPIELNREEDGSPEKTEWIYIPATYQWPSVKSLNLEYVLNLERENLKTVLTYNDFLYQDQSQKISKTGESFAPFEAVSDNDTALYLAFDQDIGKLPVNLFFPLERALFSPGQNKQNQSPPIVAWEYWNGKTWSILTVEDKTLNLTRRDMLRFLTPDDIRACLKFEKEYFWIRARLAEGQYSFLPKLKSIYNNTVWGHNRITLTGEILGSGNGKPKQTFQFSHFPVLSGQEIIVRETALTDEERKVIQTDEGKDAITEIRDKAENITEMWVRWHEVVHFHFSGPGSRHYILDHNSGKIIFGDGIKGMIPPAGKDNIKCGRYQYGGGKKGNVTAHTLTKLRTTFPYIDSVTNPTDVEGGVEMEDLEHVRVRGPQKIKNRQRAVTYEDFEWLVREASPKTALVKCLPTTDTNLQSKPGWITVIVVPESAEAKPLPSQELLNEIEAYLFSRTSTYLTLNPSQINLLGPGYIKIGSEVSVAFTSLNQAKIIEGRIIDALQKFFHPLQGGSGQKGWDFGRDVHISEVYEVIEKVEGVDYVKDLILNPSIQIYKLQLDESLPLSFSAGEAAQVRSLDNRICFALAESIAANVKIQSLRITGFKEGDSIILSYGKNSMDLTVASVSGDVLECRPLIMEKTGMIYPTGSIVATFDNRIRSYTLNEVSSQEATIFIKTAILEAGDAVSLNELEKSISFMVNDSSNRPETIFIDDYYLVYSGPHFINRTTEEKPVFPYLLNSETKELHDLLNEKPNCNISKIKREHRLFLRTIDKTYFLEMEMDYCRWCFGKEKSKS